MTVNIIIEQFDNGISIKEINGEEVEKRVALDHNKETEIGKTIWDTVKYLMEKHLTSIVRLTVDCKAIIALDTEMDAPTEED